MKRFGLALATFLAFFWRLIPGYFRCKFPKEGLKRLFPLHDRLEWIINERAMVYGEGMHPKHRLIGYHNFFIQHIRDGERVLDVGCGYGAVAKSIARALSKCEVVGIDQDSNRLQLAKEGNTFPNLSFIEGDVTRSLPSGRWDIVVLSNVLEHIVDRVSFLKALKISTSASRYLIRVPLFERNWQMPLRRELGVDYRSDNDHKIEHTLSEFLTEISEAGLAPLEVKTLWGEIWANCESTQKNASH
jgi:SAM-dependent methyltransferase